MNNFFATISLRNAGYGVIVAAAMFAVLGTVAALWQNPLFQRMTPVQGPEIALLGIMSLLFGVYVLVRRSSCSWKKPRVSGALGFIGVACPVCNKILLLIFGGELLMAYFEPVRLYVTVAGVLFMLWLVWKEIKVQVKTV